LGFFGVTFAVVTRRSASGQTKIPMAI
jgi:hypothetical protein